MKNLRDYNFPDDLKDMSLKELDLLSYAIRDFLIESVSKTGGHLASNLGVVELTIGLHKVFNSPKDKIIWDVGHQSYVHKILTGRIDGFKNLRKIDCMSGFPKHKESPHDIYETGHSSTSLSAACGLAMGRDLKGEDGEVIAVIGDGALTGGIAYEALNNIGNSKSKVIVILNDNGMSIAPNVGGVSEYLGKLRTSQEYLNTKEAIKNRLQKIPVIGEELTTNISHAKDKLKYAILPEGALAETLGFTYLGTVDGHNIEEVIEVLERSKNIKGPVFIHMITKKGKGYRNAEANPGKFHGIGPFDVETGNTLKKSGFTYSEAFGKSISKLGEEDENIVAISAAMCDATGLGEFAEKFPKRFFDVGIAEAHGITFSAALALTGLKPVTAIYSSFLQRGYDQILEDICLQNLPVVLAIDRAGVVGADGETHHGIFDLSYLGHMPNMHIFTPSDSKQLDDMLKYALSLNSPCAIRYPRGACDQIREALPTFEGQNIREFEGKDVDIWAVGNMLKVAEDARLILKEKGIDAGIVDVTTVKPIDLNPLNKDVKLIVTIEDNVLTGGFGQRFKCATNLNNIVNLGWPDKFIEHGDTGLLRERYGLDGKSVAERICDLI